MKNVLLFLSLSLLALSGCKKDAQPIEMLVEGFSSPVILDSDIVSFNQKESNFVLKAAAAKKIPLTLKANFAIRVGNEDVINGTLWPLILSSVPDGIFASMTTENVLMMRFSDLKTGKIDNREDDRLITALKNSRRLK
jgi:hypothetical protein